MGWVLIAIITVFGHVPDNPLRYSGKTWTTEQACLDAMPPLAHEFMSQYRPGPGRENQKVDFSCVEVEVGDPA